MDGVAVVVPEEVPVAVAVERAVRVLERENMALRVAKKVKVSVLVDRGVGKAVEDRVRVLVDGGVEKAVEVPELMREGCGLAVSVAQRERETLLKGDWEELALPEGEPEALLVGAGDLLLLALPVPPAPPAWLPEGLPLLLSERTAPAVPCADTEGRGVAVGSSEAPGEVLAEALRLAAVPVAPASRVVVCVAEGGVLGCAARVTLCVPLPRGAVAVGGAREPL